MRTLMILAANDGFEPILPIFCFAANVQNREAIKAGSKPPTQGGLWPPHQNAAVRLVDVAVRASCRICQLKRRSADKLCIRSGCVKVWKWRYMALAPSAKGICASHGSGLAQCKISHDCSGAQSLLCVGRPYQYTH